MKNSELRRLLAEHREVARKQRKTDSARLEEKLRELEQRYYHETGRTIGSGLSGAGEFG